MLTSSTSCHHYISSNIPISLRNFIIFSTSQSFLSSVLISPWIFCFFLLFLHWPQTCRQYFIVSLWFLHAAFSHISSWLFLDINVRRFVNWILKKCFNRVELYNLVIGNLFLLFSNNSLHVYIPKYTFYFNFSIWKGPLVCRYISIFHLILFFLGDFYS